MQHIGTFNIESWGGEGTEMEERPRRPEVRGEAAVVRGGSETKMNNAKTYVS